MKTHEQDWRSRMYYLRLVILYVLYVINMFDELMANSRIVFNTLNGDAKLDAKECHLKIARGTVHGLSSREHAMCSDPKKWKSDSAKPVVADHMPLYGKLGGCKYCKDIRKDLKSYVRCSTCNITLCLNKEYNCFRDNHEDDQWLNCCNKRGIIMSTFSVGLCIILYFCPGSI